MVDYEPKLISQNRDGYRNHILDAIIALCVGLICAGVTYLIIITW